MSVRHAPLKIQSTRVWRTYTGGKLLDQWTGLEPAKDGDYPEDWIASVTRAAYGPGGQTANNHEGLSRVIVHQGEDVLLKELIDQDPEFYLGKAHVRKYGKNTAVLTKIIDSAERLTIQVHPDKAKARELFNSRFGKTEAWYILGCREIDGDKPYVLLGFKEGVTREKWHELFMRQDIEGMVQSLHRIDVEPGQVILLEGGTPHAIGPGCMLVEIQEPSDLTFRVELTTPRGRVIPDELCHLGIGYERMFECFHYETFAYEDIVGKYVLQPTIRFETAAAVEYELVGKRHTPCFGMTLTIIQGEKVFSSHAAFSTLLVVSGQGLIRWGNREMPIFKGDRLFIPAGLEPVHCEKTGDGPLKLIRCFPPE